MRLFILLFVLPAIACGGGTSSAETTPPPTHTPPVQDMDEGEYEDEEEDFEEEVAEPTGPGQLHAVIRVGNEEREGAVSVVSGQGDVVAEGRSGETFTVPSGSYRVVGAFDAPEGQSSLYGTREESARVTPGGTAEVELRYEVARIRINVRKNGRPVARWRLVLTREGSEGEITLNPSTEHVTVPPGRYSGVLHAGASRIDVAGLQFQGGATMDVPVNVD